MVRKEVQMKKLFITTLIGIAAISFAAAQEKTEAKGDTPEFSLSKLDAETRIQLMKRFDKNGDGRLDKAERRDAIEAMKGKVADLEDLKQKHIEDIMKKFDKDGDGKLDKSEMAAFLEEQRKMFDEQRRRMGPRRGFTPPKEVLAKYDKDGDGKLSPEERRAMFKDAHEKRAALIKKYDKDGDGTLNDDERNNLIKDPEVQGMMKRMLSRPLPPPPQQ